MWVVRLTDKQLEVLRALLRSEEHLGPALQRGARGARPGPLGRASRGRSCPGTRSPRRRAARASPRPTWSGTSRGQAQANRRLGSVVVVEAGAALAAELALADQLPISPGARAALARSRVTGSRRSPPRRRGRRSRAAPAAPSGGRRRASCRSRRRRRSMPGALHQPHGVEQVGEEQPVDDEPGLVGDLDRGLAERPRTRPRARSRTPSRTPSGKQSSTSSMRLHRVEDVEAEDPLRVAAPRRRARRPAATRSCVARSASGQPLAELAEQLGLRLEVLDDRLDDEVAVGQVAPGRWSPGSAPASPRRPSSSPPGRAPRRARPRRRCGPAAGPRRAPSRRRRARRRSRRCRRPPAACIHPSRSPHGGYYHAPSGRAGQAGFLRRGASRRTLGTWRSMRGDMFRRRRRQPGRHLRGGRDGARRLFDVDGDPVRVDLDRVDDLGYPAALGRPLHVGLLRHRLLDPRHGLGAVAAEPPLRADHGQQPSFRRATCRRGGRASATSVRAPAA